MRACELDAVRTAVKDIAAPYARFPDDRSCRESAVLPAWVAVLTTAVYAVLFSGCGGSDAGLSSDGIVAQPRGESLLVEDLRLGNREPFFGSVSDIAVNDDGDIFVLDTKRPARIYRFDSTGTFVGELGGAGEGPGEFTAPTTVLSAADSLVVFDFIGELFLVYEADGSYRRKTGEVYDVSQHWMMPLGITEDGYVIEESYKPPRGVHRDTSQYSSILMIDGDRRYEKLITHAKPADMIYAEGGGSTGKPLGGSTFCAVSRTTVYCARNDALDFVGVNVRDLTQETVRVDFERLPVDDEIELGYIYPQVIEFFPDALPFPDIYPPLLGFCVDDRGRFWANVRVEPGFETTHYWIIDPTTSTTTAVRMDGRVHMMVVRNGFAYGIERSRQDDFNVVRYRVDRW